MRKICIENADGTIQAEVFPEYGGMLGKLTFKGKPVISSLTDRLHLSAVLAEGAPVLFPFAGKTKNDSYLYHGRDYYMPFHGLVKESAFAVRSIQKHQVVLWREISPSEEEENYPWKCCLEMIYRINNDSIDCIAQITNNSRDVLYHSFGWHPFFVASDKDRFFINYNMCECLDWETGKVLSDFSSVNLSAGVDLVFSKRTDSQLEFRSEADGYKVIMETPECFKSLVVCSTFDKKVCVEPWISGPDSVHRQEELAQVPSVQTRDYSITLHLEEIDGQ